MVKNLPAMQEIRVRSLGLEDSLEKERATLSTILAWRIPWTEEPGTLVYAVTESDTTEGLTCFLSNWFNTINWRIWFYSTYLKFQLHQFLNAHLYSCLNEVILDWRECAVVDMHCISKWLCVLSNFSPPILGGMVLLDWTASLSGSWDHLAKHFGRAREEHRSPAWEDRSCRWSPGGGSLCSEWSFLFQWGWKRTQIRMPANAFASSVVFGVTCVFLHCLKYSYHHIFRLLVTH